MEVTKAQWVAVRAQLLGILDTQQDSIRFYVLDSDVRTKVEHHGAKRPRDLGGPLVV
jgi:CRISPR-associated protein Cas2